MLKPQDFAYFRNWNRKARLVLDDRSWHSEKLLFYELFSKMPHLTSTGIRSLTLVAISINITDYVSLYRWNEPFWRIVYKTKVFQSVKIYYLRLVLLFYSNFENTQNLEALTFLMGEIRKRLSKATPTTVRTADINFLT